MGRLTGCCCCLNLRDGSRAIGITLLVFGSLALVGQIIGGVMMSQQRHPVSSEQIIGLVIQFVATITQLVFNSLLVHGVNKNSRGMLLAWLIYSGIIYDLQSLALAIGFVVACVFGIVWAVLLLLAVGGLLGLFWYWFVVVLHCYLDMQQENGSVYSKQEKKGEMHVV